MGRVKKYATEDEKNEAMKLSAAKATSKKLHRLQRQNIISKLCKKFSSIELEEMFTEVLQIKNREDLLNSFNDPIKVVEDKE
ncbi:MAG: hypothetical protein KAS12_04595 [Candidatus Aenigmarchaeota archaeon]|nr:hypothetical protein [Candidatus Aenigmarchaeota archaeon]